MKKLKDKYESKYRDYGIVDNNIHAVENVGTVSITNNSPKEYLKCSDFFQELPPGTPWNPMELQWRYDNDSQYELHLQKIKETYMLKQKYLETMIKINNTIVIPALLSVETGTGLGGGSLKLINAELNTLEFSLSSPRNPQMYNMELARKRRNDEIRRHNPSPKYSIREYDKRDLNNIRLNYQLFFDRLKIQERNIKLLYKDKGH